MSGTCTLWGAAHPARPPSYTVWPSAAAGCSTATAEAPPAVPTPCAQECFAHRGSCHITVSKGGAPEQQEPPGAPGRPRARCASAAAYPTRRSASSTSPAATRRSRPRTWRATCRRPGACCTAQTRYRGRGRVARRGTCASARPAGRGSAAQSGAAARERRRCPGECPVLQVQPSVSHDEAGCALLQVRSASGLVVTLAASGCDRQREVVATRSAWMSARTANV